jgi:hypothetical protein
MTLRHPLLFDEESSERVRQAAKLERMLELFAAYLMSCEGPQGELIVAQSGGRRSVALRTKSSLFTLSGRVDGAASALYAERSAPVPPAAISGVWVRREREDVDLNAWVRAQLEEPADPIRLEPEWLPPDAFSPAVYLRTGDLVLFANRPTVVRFDSEGGTLLDQANRQDRVERALKRLQPVLKGDTLFVRDATVSAPSGIEVRSSTGAKGIWEAVPAADWLLIDRAGKVRAAGKGDSFSRRLEDPHILSRLTPGEEG